MREFGTDPVSERPVVAKDGKFGVYVTDGETNASLGKGDRLDAMAPERAFELLAIRRETIAAKGGPKKKRAAKKAPARKKAAAKKSPAKKTAAEEVGGQEDGRRADNRLRCIGGRRAADAPVAQLVWVSSTTWAPSSDTCRSVWTLVRLRLIQPNPWMAATSSEIAPPAIRM